jgi:RHS repeat-associated protein
MSRVSQSRAHQSWASFSRRFLAPFVVVLLSVVLTAAISPPSSAAGRNYLPTAPKTPPIAHNDVTSTAAPRPHNPTSTAPRALAWPAAGDADVTLGTTTSMTAQTAEPTARAGKLPIVVGALASQSTKDQAKATSAAPTVHVHVASQADAHKAGVSGVLFSVGATTPGMSGNLPVGVNYAAFRDAGGADWSTRLHIVRLPACALTTPNVKSCQVQTPLPSTNDNKSTMVSASVPLATENTNSTMVMAAVAGPGGSNGTFQASSLKPSGSWSVSGSSGDFSWQYPLSVPPAASGALAPNIALTYDAQAVDGETAGTNNQTSWIGEGWAYEPGYVERTYRTCSDDTTLPTAEQTGDLCWAGQIVTMSLDGESTSLVQDDTNKTWHAASDNGDRVQLVNENDSIGFHGEYWEVTTTDGTHYFFGRNSGPGHTNQGTTNSVWTAPVYGPHAAANGKPADPCNNAAGFGQSSCSQAWRWNLDYVEDTHGNVTMYYYTPETNYYGANNGTTGVLYTRGGTLARIDYGLRDENGTVYASPAPDQVLFNTAERCIPTSTFACQPSQFTAANATNWPDTPQDQVCVQGAVCNNHGPSFFSTRRLTSITTQYGNGSGGYVKVDNYALNQQFSTSGDNALWLNSIVRTGYAADGTSITMPPISFAGQMMDNRVAGYLNQPAMSRLRVTNITAETGERINITYSQPQCTSTNVPADPSNDTMMCFPVNWTLPYDTKENLDYFHKYVTKEVDVQEPNGYSPTQITKYNYIGNPAWHFDDDEVVKPADRSYGQFRGFPEVDVLAGDPASTYDGQTDQQTLTRTRYFLGMNGDTLPGGKTRTATVTDSLGETVPDNNLFTGTAYEVQTFNGANGSPLASEITNPELLGTTASRARTGLPPLTANIVQTAKVRDITDLASGATRTTSATYGYDSLGRQTQETDSADNLPDLCTTMTYADNTTTWVRNKLAESIVSQQTCPAQGTTPAPILSDNRTYYDGSSTLGTVTNGDVTRGDSATVNNNGTLTFATTSTATFDASGRPLSTTDFTAPGAKGEVTSMAYTPADGGNLTKTVTTNAAGQTSSLTMDPGRELTTEATDVAGHTTDATYDPLGRLTAEWLPNHDKSLGAQPSTTYSYLLQSSGPQVVTSKTLVDTGVGANGTNLNYTTTTKLYDALGQLLQTQTDAEGGGRSVSDTFYDSHGWVKHTDNAYYTGGAPGTTLISVAESEVNDRTVTTYDGAGRAVLATNYNGTTATDSTQTVYSGDSTTVIPPRGGVTATRLTDARGHTTELRQYTAPPTVTGATVTGGAYFATDYSYTALGQPNAITDADNNHWSYSYDMLGRQTQANDPDSGNSSYTYDLAGNLLTSTDSRGQTLAYTYDELNRKTAEYSGSTSGTELASWVYDTVQPGKLTYSTRYTPQGNFLVGVGAYDGAGNPSNYVVSVPSSVTGLSGTYTTSYAYTSTNLVANVKPADGGGLPSEDIANTYDSLGNEVTSHGYNEYLSGASYTPFGEAAQYQLGTGNNATTLTYARDPQTRRITDVNFSANVPTPQLDDTSYTYDPAGNLTSTTDVQGPKGSPTQTTCDSYDALDRLTQAWTATDNCANAPTTAAGQSNIGGTNPYWESWSVDPTGLRTQQVQHALPGATGGDTTTNYTYPTGGSPQAHALASTSTTGPTGTASTSYGYDAEGNTTTRTLPTGSQTLTWDAENHLATDTTSAGQTSYVDDANGNELLVQDPGTTTLYLPGEELAYNNTTRTVTGTRYYTVNGQTVAVRVGGADPEYLDGDQHGTMQTVYDADHQVTTRRTFDPYGNQVGPTTSTDSAGATSQSSWPDQHGFLNDPVDSSTQLTDVGARQYDTTTGRFISVDPVLDAANPQSMTGYAYADNNPVSQSDPTGLHDPDADGTPGLQSCEMSHDANVAACAAAGIAEAQQAEQAKQQAQQQALHSAAVNKVGAAKVAAAQKTLHTSILDVVIKAGGDFLKGLLGITDMENCFGHGSIGSCVSLLLSVLPWDRIFEEGVNLVKFVVRAIDGVRDFMRATKDAEHVMEDVANTEQALKDADTSVQAADDTAGAGADASTDTGGGGEPASDTGGGGSADSAPAEPPTENGGEGTSASDAGGGSAKSSGFAPGKAAEHYRKHVLGVMKNGSSKKGGADMPEFLDQHDYVNAAHELMDGAAGDGVLEARRTSNGDILRFDPSTGAFGSRTLSGAIRTFFRPDGGESYFRSLPGIEPLNF